MDNRKAAEIAEKLEGSIAEVFVGSGESVRLAVLGLLGGMHVLVEDIPGVGKTTLAVALARSAGLSFSRIQFTPDLLPADVLGSSLWDPSKGEFIFREGPVNAQCVLADELNRTSPRTQSAFLEAMQDGRITVDGLTRNLPSPFFLIGTQNPAGFAGTFPLPEAELDRFALSFTLGYPTAEAEAEILRRRGLPGENRALDGLQAVTGPAEIEEARKEISGIHLAETVRDYLVSIVRATRNHPHVRLGASPRSAIYLQQAARARSACAGRDYVMPEDVEAMAAPVLSHRIQLSSQARLERVDAAACVRTIAAGIGKPTGL